MTHSCASSCASTYVDVRRRTSTYVDVRGRTAVRRRTSMYVKAKNGAARRRAVCEWGLILYTATLYSIRCEARSQRRLKIIWTRVWCLLFGPESGPISLLNTPLIVLVVLLVGGDRFHKSIRSHRFKSALNEILQEILQV